MGYPHDVDKIPKSAGIIFRLTQKEYHSLSTTRGTLSSFTYTSFLTFPDTAVFHLSIPTDNSRLISNPESISK